MLERMEKWVVTGPRLLYCGHARYSLVLGPGGGMCVWGEMKLANLEKKTSYRKHDVVIFEHLQPRMHREKLSH